jgi:hypothetical protein
MVQGGKRVGRRKKVRRAAIFCRHSPWGDRVGLSPCR